MVEQCSEMMASVKDGNIHHRFMQSDEDYDQAVAESMSRWLLQIKGEMKLNDNKADTANPNHESFDPANKHCTMRSALASCVAMLQ